VVGEDVWMPGDQIVTVKCGPGLPSFSLMHLAILPQNHGERLRRILRTYARYYETTFERNGY
jgi:hypothetical protein